MTWAGRRKFFYGGILIFIAISYLAYKIYPSFNVEPTCADNKQNGQERGVDCGGACFKICQNDAAPLVEKWARSFRVGEGIYNSFAYLENKNVQAAAQIIYYEFTLYDADNIFITSRKGATFIPPNSRLGIFEPAVITGKRAVKNTTFKILSKPDWVKVSESESKQVVFTEAGIVTNLEIAPKLQVSVQNSTISTIKNIDVFAIVYDENNNALGLSKTIIPSMVAGSKKDITFTWREPFAGEPVRTEIISQVNIFANR